MNPLKLKILSFKDFDNVFLPTHPTKIKIDLVRHYCLWKTARFHSVFIKCYLHMFVSHMIMTGTLLN